MVSRVFAVQGTTYWTPSNFFHCVCAAFEFIVVVWQYLMKYVATGNHGVVGTGLDKIIETTAVVAVVGSDTVPRASTIFHLR